MARPLWSTSSMKIEHPQILPCYIQNLPQKPKCIHTMHPVVFDPYLNLVLTKECCQCNKVLYDGQTLPSDVSLTDIVCTGGVVCGCAAQFHPSVGSGAHMLTHTQDSCSMGATPYAFQDQNSYGSLAGTRLDTISGTDFLQKY